MWSKICWSVRSKQVLWKLRDKDLDTAVPEAYPIALSSLKLLFLLLGWGWSDMDWPWISPFWIWIKHLPLSPQQGVTWTMSPSTTETSITVQDIIQDWAIGAVIPAAFHKHHKQQIQQLGDDPLYGLWWSNSCLTVIDAGSGYGQLLVFAWVSNKKLLEKIWSTFYFIRLWPVFLVAQVWYAFATKGW